jgi:xylulokinase
MSSRSVSRPPASAYIGVDVGSSGCKAVLVEGRRVTAEAWAGYPTNRDRHGAVTQDARHWLRALETTVRRCASQAARGSLQGIGVTAPAHNAVLVERDGTPRCPVVLWSDPRPANTAAELRKHLGSAYVAKTNVRRLDATWTLPQLVWMRRERPASLRRLEHILVGKDYLRFCLTGVALTDPTDAAGTAMYDPFRRAWLDDLPELDGIVELLPPVADATARAGTLTAAAARRLGLPRGTPLVVGATDTAAELVSVGAIDHGATLIKVATTGTVVVVTREPPQSDFLMSYPHPLGELWYQVAATSSAAAAYSWLARIVSGDLDVRRMDTLARRVGPGADGVLFLPFLDGERTPYWDNSLRAAFLGLSAAHDRQHLCRAVLEGVALSLRSCWETQLEAGTAPAPPALTGGGLASKLWREIVVAAIGTEAHRIEPQGPALGAALLAARGLSGAEPAIARRRRDLVPDPHLVSAYAALYQVYADAAASLAEASHRLVDLSGNVRNDWKAGAR